jgi:hypothetical protein
VRRAVARRIEVPSWVVPSFGPESSGLGTGTLDFHASIKATCNNNPEPPVLPSTQAVRCVVLRIPTGAWNSLGLGGESPACSEQEEMQCV